jgi:IS5 family transposase
MKNDGHLGRCYLKGRDGDAANAILTAVGYSFRRLLAWLSPLLRLILIVIRRSVPDPVSAQIGLLTTDLLTTD